MSALDALLGQVAVAGVPIELRGTLNFADGFSVTDEPDQNTIRVVAGAPNATGKVQTTDATVTPIASVSIPDNTIAVVRVRVVGRIASPSTTAMVYEIKQPYKKINAGSPATFGGSVAVFNARDDAGWGVPTLTLSGDVLTLNVTGKVATTIQWTAKIWIEPEAL